jgi:transposase
VPLEQAARKLGHRCPPDGVEVSMAGSYSADLRERVLAAVEAGATPGAAARRFAVGRSTAYRWATAARVEGRRAAKRMGGGPKPRITGEVEAALLDLLREANHLTLAACRDRLAERTGVRVHPWTMGRALRRCGWT